MGHPAGVRVLVSVGGIPQIWWQKWESKGKPRSEVTWKERWESTENNQIPPNFHSKPSQGKPPLSVFILRDVLTLSFIIGLPLLWALHAKSPCGSAFIGMRGLPPWKSIEKHYNLYFYPLEMALQVPRASPFRDAASQH